MQSYLNLVSLADLPQRLVLEPASLFCDEQLSDSSLASIPRPWMFAKSSQDSHNLPNSVPGSVNGKPPIQTVKRSRSESRSDSVRIEAAYSHAERREW